MGAMRRIGRAALVSGSVGSLTATAALMLMARREGHGALQPVNATSHWLHGEQAATVRVADLDHTAIGYATNHAATLFWAVFFEGWRAWRGRTDGAGLMGDALAIAAIAAAVDYGATPKRFTPGWELVLSRRAMAVTYGAMAAGLAAGAWAWERRALSRRPAQTVSASRPAP